LGTAGCPIRITSTRTSSVTLCKYLLGTVSNVDSPAYHIIGFIENSSHIR
jgi:hypothetical protein